MQAQKNYALAESEAVARLQEQSKTTNQTLNKIMTFCITIITGCVMLIVTFIWNLRSDFAKEQQKGETLMTTVTEQSKKLEGVVKSVEEVKINQGRQEERLKGIESRLKN